MEMDAMDWLRGCADCSCCKWEHSVSGRCLTCEERCNFEFRVRDRYTEDSKHRKK